MRKRSEAVGAGGSAPPQDKGPEFVAGAYCGATTPAGYCCRPQFKSTGDKLSCVAGHVDAPSISEEEVLALAPVGKGQAFPLESPQGAELKRELDEANERDIRENASKRPASWGSAQPAKESPVDAGFQAIVETLWVSDPGATYEHLEEALTVGDKRTDYGSVMQHLDEAERNCRLAHRLWQTAIVERKRWEIENEVVFAAMRLEATRVLQKEKASGERSKMITDADVESYCASIFGDEYKSQEVRRVKMKAMVDSMQNLSDVWLSRCKSLQTILSKQR